MASPSDIEDFPRYHITGLIYSVPEASRGSFQFSWPSANSAGAPPSRTPQEKKAVTAKGGRSPNPSLPCWDKSPSAATGTPTPIYGKPSLASFFSGHTSTQEASGTDDGVQSGWGGRPAHTRHLPAPNPPPPPQEAGQGWMRPTSWARVTGGVLGLQMSSWNP